MGRKIDGGRACNLLMDSMSDVLLAVIPTIAAYVVVRIAIWWGARWKVKARNAYMIIGQRGQNDEEREWGYRNALLAGEKKAIYFYLCAAARKFMEEKPLTPCPFDDGSGRTIPMAFYDYYLPMRIRNFGTEEQQILSQAVTDFKDGRIDATEYFVTAIAALGLTGKLTILFMPCSSERNYYMRFLPLARHLQQYRELQPVLYGMRYIATRKSKHRSTDRSQISTMSNIVLDANVVGRQNCVLVDDVCTTGDSIRSHIEMLRTYGVKVAGVVCLGRTLRIPNKKEIYKQAKKDNKTKFEL